MDLMTKILIKMSRNIQMPEDFLQARGLYKRTTENRVEMKAPRK